MSKLPIKRALINGKRRFVVYLFDLVDHLEELTDYDKSCRDELVETLKDMIKEGKFRDNIDWTYNAKRHEIALTLSSTQILQAIFADIANVTGWAYAEMQNIINDDCPFVDNYDKPPMPSQTGN